MKKLQYLLLAVNLINPQTQIQQPFPNSVIWVTHDQLEAGENTCIATVVSSVCNFINRPLAKYTLGMEVTVVAQVNCPSGCQVNINGNGFLSLKQSDGSTDQTLANGHVYKFFYDGKVLRLPG